MKLHPLCKLMLSAGILSLFGYCHDTSSDRKVISADEFAYAIDTPEKTIDFSDELIEVSDLSYIGSGKLACIHDEEGIIFIINSDDGKITNRYRFAGRGDFEGLAVTNGVAYAVNSSGVIYEVRDYDKKPEVISYETFLSEHNNVEGLCFDPSGNNLLLLCKGKPGSGLDPKKFRSVYAFDLTSKKMKNEPFLTVSIDKIERQLNRNKEENKKKFTFQPSGIALHPISGNYFIIASAGKLIVEVSPAGEVLHSRHLSSRIFQQPEGITFDKQGGMYISNEGKDGSATLLYFSQK
jgi:uncharacterized protein YjiK